MVLDEAAFRQGEERDPVHSEKKRCEESQRLGLLRKRVLCQSLPLCPTKIPSVREGIILFAITHSHTFPYLISKMWQQNRKREEVKLRVENGNLKGQGGSSRATDGWGRNGMQKDEAKKRRHEKRGKQHEDFEFLKLRLPIHPESLCKLRRASSCQTTKHGVLKCNAVDST